MKLQPTPRQTLGDLTQEHVAAAINWFVKMSDATRWNISHAEAAELLGGITVNKYNNLKRKAAAGLPIKVSRDILERLSLLLGIWKALQLVVPSDRQDLAYQWFNQPNTSHIFQKKSIKQYILDRQSMEALYVVKRYLDATTT